MSKSKINSKHPRNGATITTHFQKSDKEHMFDYDTVSIIVQLDGMQYSFQYGDSYHDNGCEKAMGIKDFLKAVYGNKFPILEICANDIEDYV